jgi:long-subunit acyl-CoA synthetase (AMP-forming)
MTCRQGSADSCDAGIHVTICSVHGLTHACCSLTVHAKHDVRVDTAGHGKRDLERPRP